MDYSVFSSVMTVLMLVIFIGIVLWAYSGKRREAFEAAARVPLEDDTDAALNSSSNAARHEGYLK